MTEATSSNNKVNVTQFNLLFHPRIALVLEIKIRIRCMHESDNPFVYVACEQIINAPADANLDRMLLYLDTLHDAHQIYKHAIALGAALPPSHKEKNKKPRTEE